MDATTMDIAIFTAALAILVVAVVAVHFGSAPPSSVPPVQGGGRPWRLLSPQGTREASVQLGSDGLWRAYVWRLTEGVLTDRRFHTYQEAQAEVCRVVEIEATFDRMGL